MKFCCRKFLITEKQIQKVVPNQQRSSMTIKRQFHGIHETLISWRSAFMTSTSADKGFAACLSTFSLNAASFSDTDSALELNVLSELSTAFTSCCRLRACSCKLSVFCNNSEILQQTTSQYHVINRYL